MTIGEIWELLVAWERHTTNRTLTQAIEKVESHIKGFVPPDYMKVEAEAVTPVWPADPQPSFEPEQCGNCQYFKQHGDARNGFCLRFPPSNKSEGGSRTPQVGVIHWCGEYRQKVSE